MTQPRWESYAEPMIDATTLSYRVCVTAARAVAVGGAGLRFPEVQAFAFGGDGLRCPR